MITAAVSGSFHRHMEAITRAVYEFASQGVRVLSPADPRVVAAQGEFLFVASDPVRSVRLVQDRHLDCIRAASFLWLECPDGYVGQSASMEIGFAAGAGIPIFATSAPIDLTLREYVRIVSSTTEAVALAHALDRPKPIEGLLIDPHASIQQVQETLEKIEEALTRPSAAGRPSFQVFRNLGEVQARLSLPTPYVQ